MISRDSEIMESGNNDMIMGGLGVNDCHVPSQLNMLPNMICGLPCGSDGKECNCNAGDLSLILESGQEDPL